MTSQHQSSRAGQAVLTVSRHFLQRHHQRAQTCCASLPTASAKMWVWLGLSLRASLRVRATRCRRWNLSSSRPSHSCLSKADQANHVSVLYLVGIALQGGITDPLAEALHGYELCAPREAVRCRAGTMGRAVPRLEDDATNSAWGLNTCRAAESGRHEGGSAVEVDCGGCGSLEVRRTRRDGLVEGLRGNRRCLAGAAAARAAAAEDEVGGAKGAAG